MAISASIKKLTIDIANMDRQYYQQHNLTMAMHPSENDARFIIRVIAFALNAHDQLVFTKGLSTDDEPELWQKSLTDEIELWIDFGQVDEKRIRKACGRAEQVIVYTYQQRRAQIWWEQSRQKLARHKNLKVFHIDAEGADRLVQRNMQLQCTIDEGHVYLTDENGNIEASVTAW